VKKRLKPRTLAMAESMRQDDINSCHHQLSAPGAHE
jgi:hypothetical protein